MYKYDNYMTVYVEINDRIETFSIYLSQTNLLKDEPATYPDYKILKPNFSDTVDIYIYILVDRWSVLPRSGLWLQH